MEVVARKYLSKICLKFKNTKYYTMTSGKKPFIVGISGATNGGKTTLSERLLNLFPNSVLFKQDDYFYPVDSPFHIPSPGGIPHINWDIISSLDMNRMISDLKAAIDKHSAATDDVNISEKERNIIILDGFTLYDDPVIRDLCDVKLFLTINKEICEDRRMKRTYDPPDPPGYFDACVWPMYLEHFKRIKKYNDIIFMDGDQNFDYIINESKKEICQKIS